MERSHILIAGQGFMDGQPREAVCFATAAGSGETNWRHGFLVPVLGDFDKAMAYLKAIQSQYPFEMMECNITQYKHFNSIYTTNLVSALRCIHIKLPKHDFKTLVIMGNLVKGPSEFPTLIDRMERFDPNTLLNDIADNWQQSDCPLSDGHFPFSLLLNRKDPDRIITEVTRHNNFPPIAELVKRMDQPMGLRKYWRTVLAPEMVTSTQPSLW